MKRFAGLSPVWKLQSVAAQYRGYEYGYWPPISPYLRGNKTMCRTNVLHKIFLATLLIPVTSIQKFLLNFPARFSALHPYRPASSKETRLMFNVLLVFIRSDPFLVQLTFGEGLPSTLHFIVNVEFKFADRFFSSGLTLGGT